MSVIKTDVKVRHPLVNERTVRDVKSKDCSVAMPENDVQN